MFEQKRYLLIAGLFMSTIVIIRKRKSIINSTTKDLKNEAVFNTTTTTTIYVNDNSTNNKKIPKASKLKHAIITNAIPADELNYAFENGVLTCYSEMQLPAYSRYEKWTQSCYMEIDERWTPRPEINQPLFESLKSIQEKCRLIFAQWYAELYALESVEVTTLNSFVTKYVPETGKNEFGKHIDGVKVQGSLVLCLPTNDPHDWPGMLVWDGPKQRGPLGRDPRPEHLYLMQPGDALLLDRMVWHHGLPITKGHRYVIVNFYAVQWKKLANADGL